MTVFPFWFSVFFSSQSLNSHFSFRSNFSFPLENITFSLRSQFQLNFLTIHAFMFFFTELFFLVSVRNYDAIATVNWLWLKKFATHKPASRMCTALLLDSSKLLKGNILRCFRVGVALSMCVRRIWSFEGFPTIFLDQLEYILKTVQENSSSFLHHFPNPRRKILLTSTVKLAHCKTETNTAP